DDDTEPMSGLANVAERARARMAAVRPAASGPAHRSKGLSGAAVPSAGAGLVMPNPPGTSLWARSARLASTAGASPGRVVVVAPAALAVPAVGDDGAAVVTVLDGSDAGAGTVSALTTPDATVPA